MTQGRLAPNLGFLAPVDPDEPDCFTVVIETPKGSRNKFGFEPGSGTFRLKHVLAEGLAFPYDFGFIPSTKGGDGDPLDVLVLFDELAPIGGVAAVRLLGVIEARQRKTGADWFENNRFIGVPAAMASAGHLRTLADLRPRLIDEIEAFFTQYNTLRGVAFEVLARSDAARARELVTAGIVADRTG